MVMNMNIKYFWCPTMPIPGFAKGHIHTAKEHNNHRHFRMLLGIRDAGKHDLSSNNGLLVRTGGRLRLVLIFTLITSRSVSPVRQESKFPPDLCFHVCLFGIASPSVPPRTNDDMLA